MNVPQEPIVKSENEGEFFFLHFTRTDRSYAPLCATFGMAARNWNWTPFSKFWIRHWITDLYCPQADNLVNHKRNKKKLHFCCSPPFQCTWSNSPDHLLKLWYDEEEAKDHNNIRLWVAACLWFFEFLQAGEVTVRSEANSDAGVHLNFPNVAIDSKYNPFMIRIPIHTKVSKTDPFCKGIHILGDN